MSLALSLLCKEIQQAKNLVKFWVSFSMFYTMKTLFLGGVVSSCDNEG